MMEESWKPVAGYGGRYEVSTLGRIRSRSRWVPAGAGSRYIRGRILSQDIGGRANNYRRVMLANPKRHAYVHHLVLETWVGSRPVDMLGCHRDDDGFNNRLDNLYWGTDLDNRADKARNTGRTEPVEADADTVPF